MGFLFYSKIHLLVCPLPFVKPMVGFVAWVGGGKPTDCFIAFAKPTNQALVQPPPPGKPMVQIFSS